EAIKETFDDRGRLIHACLANGSCRKYSYASKGMKVRCYSSRIRILILAFLRETVLGDVKVNFLRKFSNI
ncbi:MAG: hypothetical protein M1536_02945, partial [Firmicutes bacterium]|nr:hypothetical protein [Bacillota bacterium]